MTPRTGFSPDGSNPLGFGMNRRFFFASVLAACSHPTPVTNTAVPDKPDKPLAFHVESIALPGATADGVAMDYLLFDPRTKTIWVPAGNTGAVDVVDVGTRAIKRVEFPTKEVEGRGGQKRVVGPSSATLGDGVVYVGNRADSTVCAVDEASLAKGTCGALDSSPDGIQYVAPTKEVWVTTPRDKSIRVLDAATLAQKARIALDGAPEGYALDVKRGRFYTNLEDKDKTLAIDLASRAIVATWEPKCGEEGPRGLRLDEAAGVLFVACTARVEALDVAGNGAVIASVDVGEGIDDFDYARGLLYVGAAKAGTLVVARVADNGRTLAKVAQIATGEGARNGVVDGDGRVYLADRKGGRLVVAVPDR
jgi:DNA-binding beta-propeller fold protein YncE